MSHGLTVGFGGGGGQKPVDNLNVYKRLTIFYGTGLAVVFGAALLAYWLAQRKRYHIPHWILSAMMVLSLYMAVAQYLKLKSLHLYVDFSHWLQVLYHIATTGKPISINQGILVAGATNYLSVHFVPYLYVLAIPFKIWPSGKTVIILNWLIMFSSIIPLYKLAEMKRDSKGFAQFVAVCFLWYPTFQYIVQYEFELLRFSIPIIFWMLYFLEKRRIGLYFVFVFLAAFVREEVGLTLVMFGVYLWFFEKERKIGFATAAIGLSIFVLVTQAVMPALRTGTGYRYIASNSFSAFGATVGEIAINVMSHPLLVLKEVLNIVKLANVGMLFAPLLFVPLFAPAVLVSILANLGIVLISDSITHSSYMLFYVSASVPFIFYAFIKGWPRFVKLMEAVLPFSNTGEGKGSDSAVRVMVISGLLIANVFFGPSPFSLQFWFKGAKPAPFKTQNFHWSVYEVSNHQRRALDFVRRIPENAVVSASDNLHPLLFKKKGSMVYPKLRSDDGRFKAEYVFFDKTNNGLQSQSPAYKTKQEFAIVQNNTRKWQLLLYEDGYYLYRHRTS